MYSNQDVNSKPKPIPNNLINDFKILISDRVKQIDINEYDYLIKKFEDRIKNWKDLDHDYWTKDLKT